MVALSFAPIRSWSVRQGDELASTFATFDDPSDAEFIVQNLDGFAHLGILRLGEKIIDQHIEWPLKGTSRQIMEPPGQALIAGQVDSSDDL